MGTVPQEETRVQYIADGIEDIFIYPYFIPLDIDVTVWVTPAGSPPNETVDIKILNTNYTVQDAGVPGGGTITFLPGFIPGAGAQVTLSRSVVDTITTNYVDARTINGANLDESFEREMLVTQQNVTNLDLTALRYQNNAFLPDVLTRNIVPTLDPNFIWKGSASGNVVAVEDVEENGCSSLRSELASQVQGSDGTGLVGYFDENRLLSTTLRDQLNEYGDPASGQDGARLIGYYDQNNTLETNVGDQLDIVSGLTDGLPEKLQNNFPVYGNDVGAVNALAVNVAPAYIAYVPGTKVVIKVAFTNTAQNPTIDLNGLGTQTIVNPDGSPVLATDLQAGGIYEFVYDGVNFQAMTSPLHNRNPGVFSKIDTTSVINTTVETSLLGTIVGSNVVPGNYWSNGDSYKFELHGTFNNGAPHTALFRFKVNGVTFVAAAIGVGTPQPALVKFKVILTFTIRNIGAPATVFGTLEVFEADQLGNPFTYLTSSTEVLDSTLIDSTVANTLDLSTQWNISAGDSRVIINSFNSTKVF